MTISDEQMAMVVELGREIARWIAKLDADDTAGPVLRELTTLPHDRLVTLCFGALLTCGAAKAHLEALGEMQDPP